MIAINLILKQSATSQGDQIAIRYGDQNITFSQLYSMVNERTIFLKGLGFTSNTTVFLVLSNTPEAITCFLALACLNIKVVLVDSASISIHLLEQITNDFVGSAIICDVENTPNNILSSNLLQYIKIVDFVDHLADRAAVAEILPYLEIDNDGMFLYHYTSGSSGKMKAAIHSQGNLLRGAYIYIETFNIKCNDMILVAVPVAHSFGLVAGLFSALVSNAVLVIMDRFIPDRTIQVIRALSITILVATPLVFDLLHRSRSVYDIGLSSLRLCLSSGEQLHSSVSRGFQERFGKVIYKVYGTTETGVIAAQWPRTMEWPDNSVGSPLSGISVRVIDDKGVEMRPNQVGNLKVKTPTMFSGYWNDPVASSLVLQGGWYITGDLGWLDDQGQLYLSGRKDSFINIGGKKVNPVEVESVLLSHPMIADAIVFGREVDEIKNVMIFAKIVPRGAITVNEILSFCRERLANHEIPSEIELVSELPRTNLGKIRRGYIQNQKKNEA